MDSFLLKTIPEELASLAVEGFQGVGAFFGALTDGYGRDGGNVEHFGSKRAQALGMKLMDLMMRDKDGRVEFLAPSGDATETVLHPTPGISKFRPGAQSMPLRNASTSRSEDAPPASRNAEKPQSPTRAM